jgi:preprotein translocase subunit SecE
VNNTVVVVVISLLVALIVGVFDFIAGQGITALLSLVG